MSIFRSAWRILLKDLRIEWRGRARLFSVVLFGVVTLLLFSFALGADSQALAQATSGFLVMALLLSSTLGLSESFRIEHQEGAEEGLRLLPVDPVAHFHGKALGNAFFLLLLAPILVPVGLVIYGAEPEPVTLLGLASVWALASFGLAAPGTLFAAMTSRLNSQDVLLPLLLFPLSVPVLLSSVKAFDLTLNGDAMSQLGAWRLMLGSFDVVYWSLCAIVFPTIIED
ncbi:MAG: heme exporter protein CcmB [Acidobacteriota bacterium]